MILKYNIPKNYKLSTNAIYSWNLHWTKRKKIADFYHKISKADCMQLNKITKKVNIDFEFYFKSRYLDSSNCGFMAKMIEDWLVRNWLFSDDTNKYIGRISLNSIVIPTKTRKEMEWDYVRIIIN